MAKDNLIGSTASVSTLSNTGPQLKRDAWMEAPSHLTYEFIENHSAKHAESEKRDIDSGTPVYKPNIHHQTDNDGIQNDTKHEPPDFSVDYTFGDAGAQWRMTKLKAVFREAEENGRPIDDVAVERFGDLRAFDDAREEQVELDRRETYGKGYAWKQQPTGKLFKERTRNIDDVERKSPYLGQVQRPERTLLQAEETPSSHEANTYMDQTALNRLKAQVMKAKLKGSPTASKLEADLNEKMAAFKNAENPEPVLLNAMENRLLTGGRQGEVKDINTKQGRQRGQVEENEEMSIGDMIKEERRTRHEAGGDGKWYAERIAKDGKFDVVMICSIQAYEQD